MLCLAIIYEVLWTHFANLVQHTQLALVPEILHYRDVCCN